MFTFVTDTARSALKCIAR